MALLTWIATLCGRGRSYSADIEVQPDQDFINLAKICLCPCTLMWQRTDQPLPYKGPSTFLLHAPSVAVVVETGTNLTACFSHTLGKAQTLLLSCSLMAFSWWAFYLSASIHTEWPALELIGNKAEPGQRFLSFFLFFSFANVFILSTS